MNDHSVKQVSPRREREKQERRAAILAAAERVIIERGFADASVEVIAREAGFAAGTVYLYFPNKEALFQELLGGKIRKLNEAVAAEAAQARPFSQALPAVVQAMFRHFDEERGFFEIFTRERIEFARNAPQSEVRFREMDAGLQQLEEWIGAAQRRGEVGKRSAQHLAVALRGLVFQFTRDWLRSGAAGKLTRHTAFVSGFFLKGAAE